MLIYKLQVGDFYMSKYYEISISDGKINHTTITIKDKENKEVVKIYGTLKEK